MNNTLRALLCDSSRAPHWVEKIPAIIVTLNSIPHQPHGYSTSMIAIGQENTLPLDLVMGAQSFKGQENPLAYVSSVLEWLREAHQ